MLCYVMIYYVAKLWYVMLLCYDILLYVAMLYVMLWYVAMQWYVILCETALSFWKIKKPKILPKKKFKAIQCCVRYYTLHNTSDINGDDH